MAKKEQCLNCVHYNYGLCGLDNVYPRYNMLYCDSFKKVGSETEDTEKDTIEDDYVEVPDFEESQSVGAGKQEFFARPFSFEGRIRRTEYALSFLMVLLYFNLIERVEEALWILLAIPAYWFLWAQGAKRCHDRNNTGWYQIIPFYVFWMLFGDGDAFENDFGPDPKGRDNH